MEFARLAAVEIASMTGGRVVHGNGAAVVTGAALDSRAVQPGDLFVAIVGERVDGHAYAASAAAAGAACLLVREDRWPLSGDLPPDTAVVAVADPVAAIGELGRRHRQQQRDLTVVGVTGSVGKTSTKDIVAAVLGTRGAVLKNPGNLNSQFSLPLVLLELTEQHRFAVLEMGMRARGDIAQLCTFAEPEIGVVTNIGVSHLEVLGSVEQIARAKAELVEALPRSGHAMLPADDVWHDFLADRSRAPVVSYGFGAGAVVTARDVRDEGLQGTSFTLCLPDEEAPARLSAPGRHQVINALAAAAVGHVAGLRAADIAAGFTRLQPSAQRAAVRQCGGVTVIDDTYNASPASMTAALDLLATAAGHSGGRPIAVLGDMYELGGEAERGHRDTGAYAVSRRTAVLVAVGALGRLIGEGAIAEGMSPGQVLFATTNEEAVAVLQSQLRQGDTVLVKGSRGMQMERIVAALCPEPDSGG